VPTSSFNGFCSKDVANFTVLGVAGKRPAIAQAQVSVNQLEAKLAAGQGGNRPGGKGQVGKGQYQVRTELKVFKGEVDAAYRARGILLGKGGENLKHISEKSGLRIILDGDTANKMWLVVVGPPPHVSAMKMVRDLVDFVNEDYKQWVARAQEARDRAGQRREEAEQRLEEAKRQREEVAKEEAKQREEAKKRPATTGYGRQFGSASGLSSYASVPPPRLSMAMPAMPPRRALPAPPAKPAMPPLPASERRWQICLAGTWRFFDAASQREFERAYAAGKTIHKFNTRGWSYILDFKSMLTQVSHSTTRQRLVRRLDDAGSG